MSLLTNSLKASYQMDWDAIDEEIDFTGGLYDHVEERQIPGRYFIAPSKLSGVMLPDDNPRRFCSPEDAIRVFNGKG